METSICVQDGGRFERQHVFAVRRKGELLSIGARLSLFLLLYG